MVDSLYNTGNAVGSTDAKDLHDNAIVFDELMNADDIEISTRLGKKLQTIAALQAIITSLDLGSFTFSDVTSGLAGTTSGQFFRVPGDSENQGGWDYYRNDSGLATNVASIAGSEIVNEAINSGKLLEQRVDNIHLTERSVNPYEVTDLLGKLVHAITVSGLHKMPGGIDTPRATINQLSPQQVMPVKNRDIYPNSETDSAGRVIWATEASAGKKIYLGRHLADYTGLMPGDFFAIGDSITAYGGASSAANAGGTSYYPAFNDQSWHAWASMFSNGLLRFSGFSATPGYTSAQILKTHLPVALKSGATFCVVMAGRNDVVQSIDIDNVTIPNMRSMFTKLLLSGITPVVCLMSAQGNSSDDNRRKAEHKLNGWLRSYAKYKKLPLVNLHGATVDPKTGDWISGFNQDVSHPNGVGAKAMGKALYQGLIKWVQPTSPAIAEEQLALGLTDNVIANPLFLNSTNNVPSSWNVSSSTSTVVTSDSSRIGNVWSTTGAQATLSASVVAGNKYTFGFYAKSTGEFDVYLTSGTGSGQVVLAGLRNWKTPIDDYQYFSFEFTPKTGQESLAVNVRSVGTLSLSQIGLIKQTGVVA